MKEFILIWRQALRILDQSKDIKKAFKYIQATLGVFRIAGRYPSSWAKFLCKEHSKGKSLKGIRHIMVHIGRQELRERLIWKSRLQLRGSPVPFFRKLGKHRSV
jgi:hypothetical protein